MEWHIRLLCEPFYIRLIGNVVVTFSGIDSLDIGSTLVELPETGKPNFIVRNKDNVHTTYGSLVLKDVMYINR
jgi:hypothetical protein